ncbi:MAG: histidine kinase dimerization/phosphoacceptor domain -containing protein [Vicingaceae bacterium]
MNKKRKVNKTFSVLIGCSITAITFFALNYFGQEYLADTAKEVEDKAIIELEETCARVDQALNQNIFLSKSLVAFIQYDTSFTSSEFQHFSAELYNIANKEIQAVQLVKDSIISYNYPEEGNEVTIGKNILQIFDDRSIVRKSMKERTSMLIGPRKLLQGSMGLVYREPIIIKDKNNAEQLWGFAAIVINLDQLVDNSLMKPDSKISIYSDNPSMFNQGFFIGDSSVLSQPHVKAQINLPQKKWWFYLNIEEEMRAVKLQKNMVFWSTLILALILGILSAKETNDVRKVILLNELLAEKNQKISKQLNEKVLLIKEIHHRIKNHFQLISSLNQLMLKKASSKETQEVIETVNQRINTLSKAYDQFDSVQNAKNFMPDYISTLAKSLLLNGNAKVNNELQIDDIELTTKRTVTVGVLLNELIINSLKHSFSDKEDPCISIKMIESEKEYILSYADNGGKLPENYLDLETTSTGVQLIKLFTEQLNGQVIQFKKEEWDGIQIRFPKL